MNEPVVVTGAAGHFGRRAVELLLEGGHRRVIAATRDPARLSELQRAGVEVRRADFDEPSSLSAAFEGARRALLISTDSLMVKGQRLSQHLAALNALERAGVRHVVYTSLVNAQRSSISFAPDHAGTEAALARSGLGFTALQNNFYSELLLQSLPQAVASGVLADARGEGRVAYVSREDLVRAAVNALLTADEGARQTLVLNGPQSLSNAELAALASSLSGKPVSRVSVAAPALSAQLTGAGLPPPIVEMLLSVDLSASRGEMEGPPDQTLRLVGRPLKTVREVLASAF